MSFLSWRNVSTLTIASLLSIGFSDSVYGNDNQSHNSLSKIETNSIDFLSTSNDELGQVTSVSQLSDVSPTDWAYEALRSLVERYGCIVGYPDRTFRGNRALSRYEFAAGLNACMQQIERLVAGGGGADEADLATLRRLVGEFETELATLGARVDNLEGRVAFLEDHQFSTTTKLSGEVIFTLANAFNNNADSFEGGGVDGDNTVFANRARLNFDTSFTGRDRLRVRLQAGNFNRFGNSNMFRLGHEARGDNDVEINDLYYRFPVGENIRAFIGTNGLSIDNIFEVYNPYLASGGTGALSRFIRRDPLNLRAPEGAGAGVQIGVGERVGLNLLYLANDANDPSPGSGLFDGGYSAGAQLTFNPSQRLDLAFSYLRTYETVGNVGLASGTVSSINTNNPFDGDATSADRFGLQGNLRISPRINIAASGGYVSANNLTNVASTRSDAELWTWFTGISFLDVGKEGGVLSIAGGMPPRSQFETDTSYLVELQYRYPVNRNITITPGVYAIFNPEHNSNNDTVYIGAIRTTFSF